MRKLTLTLALLIGLMVPAAALAVDSTVHTGSQGSTGTSGSTTGGAGSSVAGGVAGTLIGCGAAAAVGGAVAAASAAAGTAAAVAGVITYDPANHLSNTTTAVNETTHTTVECILNGLVYALKQGLIAALVQSTIDWINSGFDGGPSYVTNLDDFLGEIADNTSLDFLQSENSPLALVCSPFKLQIKATLALQSGSHRQTNIQCSLSDATANIERFIGGDFSQGGWPAWFSMTTNIQNNPYGAYAESKGELALLVASRQGVAIKKLDFSGGFFDKQVCDQWSTPGSSDLYIQGGGGYAVVPGAAPASDSTQPKCLHYSTVTPGEEIAKQLHDALGSGLDELKLADQINEIVDALLAQLGKMALTSIEGVAGLSSSHSSSASAATSIGGSGRTGSYLDQLVDSTQNGSLAAGQGALMNDIGAIITSETTYQDTLKGILTTLTAADAQYHGTYTCYLATQGINFGTATSTTAVSPVITHYNGLLTLSQQLIARLTMIRDALVSVQSVAQLNAISSEYDTVLQSGYIHTTGDLLVLQNEAAIESQALTAMSQGTAQLGTCQPTP